jgi:hypothetical protein
VPTTLAMTSILGPMVLEECQNSGLDAATIQLDMVAASIQLKTVAAMSKFARLREILPMTSRVLDPSEDPVT